MQLYQLRQLWIRRNICFLRKMDLQSLRPSYNRNRCCRKNSRKSYDALGNLELISILHENKNISFCYNLENQPISSIESRGDGIFTSQNDYDLLGRKISSTDCFGNTTSYDYDFCHRIVKTTHPPVLDETGKANCPIFSYTYDLFDNISSITDPQGHTIYTSRNLRGDPTKITYPDGTFELFKYDPEAVCIEA